MQILIIGSTGLIGTRSYELIGEKWPEVVGTYRSADGGDVYLDKQDRDRVKEVVIDHAPDAIIDTAAFHAVDDCETHREKAWEVNADGTANVARAANEIDAHYVFLSTDYVFPGDPDEAPYTESDPVAPPNYYARTKLAGEQAARIADRYTVLRPSVVYGAGRDNFATWALGELRAGNEIGIVDNQTSAPTYAGDVARACVEVVERGLTGLYHATGPESLSRYEFTLELAAVYDLDPDLVEPITTEELGQEAPRPEDSTLDSSRLYDAIDYEFRPPRKGFRAMRDRT